MRAFVLLLAVASASALPQPQAATGQSNAQVSTSSVQQTGDSLSSLTDTELLAALTSDIQVEPHPDVIVDPVPTVEPTPDPSDAELLAALGLGANQGESVRCQASQYYCVPYYLCQKDEIITDGASLIDIRFGGSSANDSEPLSHSECPSYIDVCCRDPTSPPDPPTPEPYVPRCGRRNDRGINVRITGFQEGESQFGEIPWMAAVLRVEDVGGEEKNLFVCGGALIHPQVVMTAAHCIAKQADARLRVRLGEWDTQHTTEFYAHEDFNVAKVEVHERFNGRNLHNDMALLFLEQPVTLKEHIDTLCLPEPGVDYTGAECIATGWGKDRFDSGQYQTVLKQVALQRVGHDYCQQQLRTTRLGGRFNLDASFTCAGAPPTVSAVAAASAEADKSKPVADTCTGDGGSPLACRDPAQPDRYVHGGVVAWGIGCGEKGIPGVYADPQQFLYWIDEHVSAYFQLPTSYFGFQNPAVV